MKTVVQMLLLVAMNNLHLEPLDVGTKIEIAPGDWEGRNMTNY